LDPAKPRYLNAATVRLRLAALTQSCGRVNPPPGSQALAATSLLSDHVEILNKSDQHEPLHRLCGCVWRLNLSGIRTAENDLKRHAMLIEVT
jgi:hypothetical protein